MQFEGDIKLSVEISGAAGYDYQDLICLYLSLLLKKQENIQIKIETSDGEDCEVKYLHNGVEYIIDVQVKNRANLVEISEYSEWLAHFERLSSTNHLFSKLNNDINRFLLFVTNSRVENDLISFVQKENIPLHEINTNGFNNELIDKLKVDVLKSISGTTDLALKRRETLDDFCSKFSKPVFRIIFKKIKLWELQDAELVRERIGVILNKEFLVPKSKIDSLILELTDIIKYYKRRDESIVEHVIAKIDYYSERYILSEEEIFIEHEGLYRLQKALQENNILLLSGVSLCGKSFNAKKIATEYQKAGYHGLLTSDVDEALNFVLKKNIEDKILVLEDPFGAIAPEKRSSDIIRKIEAICQNQALNIKIIITSRSDILLNIFNVDNLDKCKINGTKWFDLTNRDTVLIEGLWDKKNEGVPDRQVLEMITRYLEDHSKDNFLQIGELNYLLNNKSLKELEQLNVPEIIDIARVNANHICNYVINDLDESAKLLFIALTLAGNTTKFTQIKHIKYLLSQSTELYSIKQSKIGTSFSLSDRIDENQPSLQWNYNDVFDNKITGDFKKSLLEFKKYGYIAISKEGIIFTHPIYQHAGYLILMKELEIEYLSDDNILSMIKRGISTTSKHSSIAAIKVLEYLYTTIDNKNPFLNLLLLGLDSIFPSVIDRSITFLLKNFNDFDKETQKHIIDNLMFNKDTMEKIDWKNDEPYLYQKTYTMDWVLKNLLKQNEIGYSFLKKDALTSKEVWEVLKLEYKDDFKQEYLQFLNKAIYLDEVFIKEKAYYKLFKYFVHEDESLMSVLKYNEHPSIIYKSFIGMFHSWGKYPGELKEKMIQVLKEYLKEPPVSIRFLRFLENFQDEYATDGIKWSKLEEEQKIELWKLWYELFYIIFDTFSFDFNRINTPHLVAVADNSLTYINDSNLVVNFALLWNKWLKTLSVERYPDDFAMSVADYLMKGTRGDSSSRITFFENLLSDDKTSLITTHLSHFIEYWDFLNQNEKDLILKLINSSRHDNKWLRAISLTRNVIPKEIQISLFGQEIIHKGSNVIISELSKIDLLEPCLNIYTGSPQPLFWNGYHHKNRNFWNDIICEVLKSKRFDQSFRLALKEFIDSLYNYSGTKNALDLYSELLQDENSAKLVFEELVFVSSTQNQANKEMWDKFKEKEYFFNDQFYLNLIIQNIEALQYQQLGDDDLFAYFDSEDFFKFILPKFESDQLIFNLILMYENYMNENEVDFSLKILEMIKLNLGLCSLKLNLTNTLVRNILNKFGALDENISAIIEKNRLNYIYIKEETSSEIRSHYELANWQY